MTYRMILAEAAGAATGANLAGCSPSNPTACDPRWFPGQGQAAIDAAVAYAGSRGETPVLVANDQEAWAIVNGTKTPDPSQVLSGGWPWYYYAVGAYLVWRFLK